MIINAKDRSLLSRLEESLWRAETRFDRKYMNETLAPDFFEFGRSGRVYKRDETIEVEAQPIEAKLPLKNFDVHSVSADVALVTYISEVVYDGVTEVANRSSLWSRIPRGWHMRFHQGTPI